MITDRKNAGRVYTGHVFFTLLRCMRIRLTDIKNS